MSDNNQTIAEDAREVAAEAICKAIEDLTPQGQFDMLLDILCQWTAKRIHETDDGIFVHNFAEGLRKGIADYRAYSAKTKSEIKH